MPNGPSASDRVVAVTRRSSSTVRYPAAMKPNPPALVTATVNAGVDGPPAMGAWMMGTSPSCSMSSVHDRGARFRNTVDDILPPGSGADPSEGRGTADPSVSVRWERLDLAHLLGDLQARP